MAVDDVSCSCSCPTHLLRSRRLFTGLLASAALPVWAQQKAPTDEGVKRDVGKESKFTKLVPAEQVEAAAQKQYAQMLTQAQQQKAWRPTATRRWNACATSRSA